MEGGVLYPDRLVVELQIRGRWQVGVIHRVDPPPVEPAIGETPVATLVWGAWLKGRPPDPLADEREVPAATPVNEIQAIRLWQGQPLLPDE
jgi:hypothetical protein